MGMCLPPGRHISLAAAQPGVLRHIAEQINEFFVLVQVLDAPVLQLWDQVVELLQKIDAPALVEQVLAVPTISLDRIPQRSACRRPRRAEQLVEVPSIISYSSLHGPVEQNDEIPVPHGRRDRDGGGGLQGFLPGRGSAASSSSSHVPAGAVDEPFQGVFSPLPQGPRSGSELGADFNPWTPAAYADSMALEEDELETESESRSEVEEDAATRFRAGFRPLRVCMRFLELHMGRACGDRCTFAHTWAELHPEASAHEQELASYLPD